MVFSNPMTSIWSDTFYISGVNMKPKFQVLTHSSRLRESWSLLNVEFFCPLINSRTQLRNWTHLLFSKDFHAWDTLVPCNHCDQINAYLLSFGSFKIKNTQRYKKLYLVPAIRVWTRVWSSGKRRAMPKSAILGTNFSSSRILLHLMSRWMMVQWACSWR